jgi:hypothetical protein
MANFLIDASMPRPTAALLASYSHTGTDVRDIGINTMASRSSMLRQVPGVLRFSDLWNNCFGKRTLSTISRVG